MPELPTLLIGEICIDYSLPTSSPEPKMRLGGVVHAARALWAAGMPYSIAAYCPAYLAHQAEQYLQAHGCCQFILLGEITGAPNVVIIGDVREVGHQGYEDILRDSKEVRTTSSHAAIDGFSDVVIFPGKYDLNALMAEVSSDARITIDVAYDIDSAEKLRTHSGRIQTLAISTSSQLFLELGANEIAPLVTLAESIGAKYFLLKENRGGSRLFDIELKTVDEIPAVLGATVNSVGVGDAFTAILGAAGGHPPEAAWRGMQVATVYSQTTYPDDLKRDVEREFNLSVATVRGLGGVQLPWHDRQDVQIYLAAPDFSYIEKHEIDAAIRSLEYHNFKLRRPVQENGEADPNTPTDKLRHFYDSDVDLLRECSAVFAIPLNRDPGTLVEVGMAISMGKPVITYDPRKENNNTMVVVGSSSYSSDLDESLNAIFLAISKIRAAQK